MQAWLSFHAEAATCTSELEYRILKASGQLGDCEKLPKSKHLLALQNFNSRELLSRLNHRVAQTTTASGGWTCVAKCLLIAYYSMKRDPSLAFALGRSADGREFISNCNLLIDDRAHPHQHRNVILFANFLAIRYLGFEDGDGSSNDKRISSLFKLLRELGKCAQIPRDTLDNALSTEILRVLVIELLHWHSVLFNLLRDNCIPSKASARISNEAADQCLEWWAEFSNLTQTSLIKLIRLGRWAFRDNSLPENASDWLPEAVIDGSFQKKLKLLFFDAAAAAAHNQQGGKANDDDGSLLIDVFNAGNGNFTGIPSGNGPATGSSEKGFVDPFRSFVTNSSNNNTPTLSRFHQTQPQHMYQNSSFQGNGYQAHSMIQQQLHSSASNSAHFGTNGGSLYNQHSSASNSAHFGTNGGSLYNQHPQHQYPQRQFYQHQWQQNSPNFPHYPLAVSNSSHYRNNSTPIGTVALNSRINQHPNRRPPYQENEFSLI